MDIQELEIDLENLSFIAGMNQRYHQIKWTRFHHRGKLIRISVGIATILSMLLSVLSATLGLVESQPNLALNLTSIGSGVTAVLSACIAVWLNVSPSNGKEIHHHGIYGQWCDFREEVDSFAIRVRKSKSLSQEHVIRLMELTAKKNRINKSEDAVDEALLNECFEKENIARTGFATQEEKRRYDSRSVAAVGFLG